MILENKIPQSILERCFDAQILIAFHHPAGIADRTQQDGNPSQDFNDITEGIRYLGKNIDHLFINQQAADILEIYPVWEDSSPQ